MRKNNSDTFWGRVRTASPNDCWEFLGRRGKKGYGYFDINGKAVLAHRFAYRLTHGKIPKSKPFVLHSCNNPPCCNPSHLFVGTHQDNMNQMVLEKRHADVRGEKNGNSKLRNSDIPKILKCLQRGEYQRTVAKKFGVSQTTIWLISHGKRYATD